MTTAAPSTALATIQPVFSDPERLTLAGFLAGYRGLTHEAYALDLRQFTAWCRARSLALFAVRRADIEGFARELEARGRAEPGGYQESAELAAGPPGPVDPAADLAVPGSAWYQRAHALPASPAGGDMAAAQADRLRRSRPRPGGGGHRGPAAGAAAPVGGVRRRRNASAPSAACAGELDAARYPPEDSHPGQEPAGHCGLDNSRHRLESGQGIPGTGQLVPAFPQTCSLRRRGRLESFRLAGEMLHSRLDSMAGKHVSHDLRFGPAISPRRVLGLAPGKQLKGVCVRLLVNPVVLDQRVIHIP